MNRKILLIASTVIVLVLLGVILMILRGDEDTWLCQNGEWVKHGNPSASMPTTGCVAVNGVDDDENNGSENADIKLSQPKSGEEISSPLLIEGEARGTWFFEASFPVKLIDQNGSLIAIGIAQAQSDWMAENFVPFKAELKYVTTSTDGFLVLERDNPSGLPENDKNISIPVKIASQEIIEVKAYFSNNRLDPEISCDKVFPVARKVVKTPAVARAALEELLAGPNEKETAEDFSSSVNQGVKINSLVIEKGIAKVDFDKILELNVAGSCRVIAIRSQITETLKQFDGVQEVNISIDGVSEGILQP